MEKGGLRLCLAHPRPFPFLATLQEISERRKKKWREKGFPYSFCDLQSSTLNPNRENGGMEGLKVNLLELG